MPTSTKSTFRLCGVAAVTLLATSFCFGSEAVSVDPPRRAKPGEFVFSILPKAFQRSPDLEMTVNTEMTPYGRLLRTPTPENPVYYVEYSSGFKALGDSAAGEKSPPPERIKKALHDALAKSGFLPASPEHKPGVAILYFWGSHNRMDPEMEANFPQLAAKHRLERAMLIGGHDFQARLGHILEWGESLTDRTADYEFLRDQAVDDLYYVVASAYDYNALSQNQRKLEWRTSMTVAARGVAMDETLMPLIASAGPYFGRDMNEPQIVERRINRWSVKVGEDKVIEGDVPNPASPTTPEPRITPKKK